jgi:hypothetical protein
MHGSMDEDLLIDARNGYAVTTLRPSSVLWHLRFAFSLVRKRVVSSD